MKLYTITANGTEMGTFDATDADAAVLAYVQDAGYSSVKDAAEALSKSEDEFLAEIRVDEFDGDFLRCEVTDVRGRVCVDVNVFVGSDFGHRGFHGRAFYDADGLWSRATGMRLAVAQAVGQALMAGADPVTLRTIAQKAYDDDARWDDGSEGAWKACERVYR